MSIANTPVAFPSVDAVVFQTDEVSAEPTKRWTVAEYHELIRQGFLNEDDPYELIEGWLVRKMTKNSSHNYVVRMLNQILATQLDHAQWIVDCQGSLTLADGEPEPDFAILQGPASKYAQRNPQGAEAPLVIEVSDTTLRRDRGMKLRSYARAGIPQYWIVNLIDRQIEVYTQPTSNSDATRYEQMTAYQADAEVPVAIAGQELFRISVAAVLPTAS